MPRNKQDIEADITEIKQLILSSKRPNNQAVLAKHLSSLKTQLESLVVSEPQPVKIEAPVQPVKVTEEKPSIIYKPLTTYSWDQEGNKIKIYFSLENIGKQCSADQIDVKFEKQAVEIKIRNYKKNNLLFAIKKLYGTIDIESCKYFVKTNMMSITMFKKENKHWSQLHYKEEKLEKSTKEDTKDPQAGIMNMMKKMYEEGDDNMKRTIAEAWSKGQEKKGGDLDQKIAGMDMNAFGDRGFGFKDADPSKLFGK